MPETHNSHTRTARETSPLPPAAGKPRIVDGMLHAQSPRDLRPLTPVATTSIEALPEMVAKARRAQRAWQDLGLERRIRILRRAAKRMLARREEIIEIVRSEVGKLEIDALMSEALGPLDQLEGWAAVVRGATRRKSVRLNPIAFPQKRAHYDLLPRGVVAVIAPWNYALAAHFRTTFPALLTGNAVVLKPSEYAPRSARWFADQLSPDLPEGLLQVAVGDGHLGAALIGARVDALVFTGSVGVGREVQKAAAAAGIPVSAEMGGNDPAIVLHDCDLERTVMGVTHWALHNAGQACCAVEVVLVEERVADRFVAALARAWQRLRWGDGPFAEVDVSPLTNAAQLATVERQVEDALARGATLVCGGERREGGLFYAPTILDRCDESMEVVREETFGPVIAVVRVRDADEAIELANRSRYGLTASVWSRDLERAERLGERLDYGIVTINNHALTGAIAALPWSGTRDTGHSVANSSLALSTLMRPRTVLVDSAGSPEPFWLPFDADLWELGDILADVQLGRLARVWKLPLLQRRRLVRLRRFFSQQMPRTP